MLGAREKEGKFRPKTRWRKLQEQRLESRDDGECQRLDSKRVSIHVYVEHNYELERGL